jgi:hypothetical protein
LQEVIELAVNITADGDGAIDRLDVGLFEKELLDLFAQLFEIRLRERLALSDGLEPLINFGAHDDDGGGGSW